MKTVLKPLLLMAVALTAVVGIVFCSLLLWIKSNRGLEWVQSQINTAIPGTITIESHRLSLLKPSLDLYQVLLHDPHGVALAGFSHLSAELDWWALWRREIRLEAMLLEAPWADLALHETRGLNLMTALAPPAQEKERPTPAPDGAGLPFNLVVDSFQLTDGRLTVVPSSGTTRLATTGISLAAAGNLMARSGSLDLALASVRFSSAGIHPEPARIVLKARLDGGRLSVPALDVTSGQTTLQLSGSADSLHSRPMLDSILSVDSQLSELKAIFDLAGDYSGAVTAKLTVKGPLANPDATLVLTVGGGRIAGRPLDRGDLSISQQDRQVTIDTAALRLAGGAVILNGAVDLRDAFPEGFLAPPADVDATTYALTLVQDIPDLNPWLQPLIDISGRMTGRVSINGRGLTPSQMATRLTLQEKGDALFAPGMDRPVSADVNLSAQIDRGTLSVSHLNAAVDGVELSGSGHLEMDGRALDAKLSLAAADLSRVLAVVGIPSVNGACNAALTVDGNLNRPQFSLNLASNNLTVGTFTVGDLTIDADMDPDGLLNLHTLTLQNRGSRVWGNGRLRLLPNSGDIDPGYVNVLNLTLLKLSAADFLQSPPIEGTLDGRLQLGGPLASLTGELSLNGSALSAGSATIGDVDARLRLSDGTVFVDRLNLHNQDSRFTAAGSIGLLAPETLRLLQDPSFDFAAESDHFDPGDFVDALSGDFSFIGTFTGSVAKPAGRFTLAGRQANLAGQPLQTISLDARLEERRLWLDRLRVALARGEQIDGGGWVGLDNTLDLQLKTDGIAVSNIQWLQDFFPGQGVLRFDVNGQGSMDNPDIQGHLTVSDMIINDEALEDFDLTFSLHDMLAKATGNLNFKMDAACDLKKGAFDARLIFDRTETNSYFKAAGQPDFHGTLTGLVQASGNIREAASASAQVDLSALNLLYKDIPLIQSERMVLQLADQKLTIADLNLAVLSSGSMLLKGKADFDGRLDLEVDGRIPLSAAGVFSDAFTDSTGILALSGRVSGDAADPRIDARVDLQNIAMTVPGLAQQLHDLNGRIQLSADRIRIDALSGFLDTGTFSIDGSMDHETFTPKRMDFTVTAKSLPLEVPDTLAVLLNGDINITGNDRSAVARGEIVLLEGVYYKDVKINLLQMATARQRTVTPAAKALSIPYFDTVDLDIAVGHRQPFIVQNNLAQLEISPDLKIGGALERPIVSGRAQVKSGTVTFQKKTFDVKKGIIDFINPYKTEAEIDIESEAVIRSWTIKLAIKGTPDNLDLKLSSVPTETDSDILSLILFGRTAQELTAGEGSAKRTTGQIMAEMVAETFGEDLKKTTGVDILKLETNDANAGQDDAGVKVTVGKHLSDRMTVKYAVESKDGEVIQRAITEYKLLENILVSGFQDNQGIYGSELVFRIEFR